MPTPGPGELLIEVTACGVCRTDLHVADGELPNPKLPLIPGHEIVGVAASAPQEAKFRRGERVGVPWLARTCGACPFCLRGQENLCDSALFTGYTRDGGYAEFVVADERFCYRLPQRYADAAAAPLLCAGLIGYRSYRMVPEWARTIGFYGFGASAHIIAQVAMHQGRSVYAFTRPGDARAQELARGLGCVWAGGSDERPPAPLDAAIIFAPVGALVPAALRAVTKGGTVVCGGIHMSDIPSFPYRWLWEERVLKSVANLQRRDGEDFFAVAAAMTIRTQTQIFPLADANEALRRMRSGELCGAAVLEIPR